MWRWAPTRARDQSAAVEPRVPAGAPRAGPSCSLGAHSGGFSARTDPPNHSAPHSQPPTLQGAHERGRRGLLNSGLLRPHSPWLRRFRLAKAAVPPPAPRLWGAQRAGGCCWRTSRRAVLRAGGRGSSRPSRGGFRARCGPSRALTAHAAAPGAAVTAQPGRDRRSPAGGGSPRPAGKGGCCAATGCDGSGRPRPRPSGATFAVASRAHVTPGARGTPGPGRRSRPRAP